MLFVIQKFEKTVTFFKFHELQQKRFSFFVIFGDEVTKISCHFQAKTVQLFFSFFVIYEKRKWDETLKTLIWQKVRENSRFVNSLFMICNLPYIVITPVGWFKLSRHGKLTGLVFPAFQTPAVHFPKVLPEKSTFTWLNFLVSKNTLN